MKTRYTGFLALLTATLCLVLTLHVSAKPGNGVKFRTVDGMVLGLGVTNNVITLDLSEGKPGGKYVIQYTTDFNTWPVLSPAHLSGSGTFRYEYATSDPHCFYRIVPEP